jgi:hypothetical protein
LVAPLRHMCDICGGADLQLAKIAVKMPICEVRFASPCTTQEQA